MRWLRLVRLDERSAHLAAAPGRRDVMNFLTDRQRTQLAELLRPIVGRKLSIELTPAQPASSSTGGTAACPQPPATAKSSATAQSPDDDAQRLTPRQALELPLVKQVLAIFDADIVDVRPEKKPDQNAADSTADDRA